MHTLTAMRSYLYPLVLLVCGMLPSTAQETGDWVNLLASGLQCQAAPHVVKDDDRLSSVATEAYQYQYIGNEKVFAADVESVSYRITTDPYVPVQYERRSKRVTMSFADVMPGIVRWKDNAVTIDCRQCNAKPCGACLQVEDQRVEAVACRWRGCLAGEHELSQFQSSGMCTDESLTACSVPASDDELESFRLKLDLCDEATRDNVRDALEKLAEAAQK